MKKFNDPYWGRRPKKYVPEHQKEEIALIEEWREWNSDLKVGENLVNNTRKEDTYLMGKRILILCEQEMTKICKRLEEIRYGKS